MSIISLKSISHWFLIRSSSLQQRSSQRKGVQGIGSTVQEPGEQWPRKENQLNYLSFGGINGWCKMAMLIHSLCFMPSIPRLRAFAFIVITSEPKVGQDQIIFLVLYNVHNPLRPRIPHLESINKFRELRESQVFRFTFQSRESCSWLTLSGFNLKRRCVLS